MKRFLGVALLWVMAALAQAQVIPGLQVTSFTATGTGTPIYEANTPIVNHQLKWNVFGTVTTCQVKVEQSATGAFAGEQTDLIANQTCTSNGLSAITAGTPNWVRVNVTTFSGSGSVIIGYTGFSNAGGAGSVTNSGTLTNNAVLLGAGNAVAKASTACTDTGSLFSCTEPGQFGSGLASNSTTTNNLLAKVSGANVVAATTADTNVPVFVVTSGGGTTSVFLATPPGQALCTFDGPTTVGDFVVASATVPANCSDAGASLPTTKWVIGQVLSTNAGTGTYNVQLFAGFSPSAGGGGGTSFGPGAARSSVYRRHTVQQAKGENANALAPDKFGDAFDNHEDGTATNVFSTIPLRTDTSTASDGSRAATSGTIGYVTTNNPSLLVEGSFGATTNQNQWISLSSLPTATMFGNGTPANALNPSGGKYCGFRFATGTDTHYTAFCADGTTQSTGVDTGVTPDTSVHVWEIVITSGTNAKFYIDNVLKATVSTNLPASNVALGFTLGLVTKGANANSFSWNRIVVEADN